MSGFPSQLPRLITVPHGWAPSPTSPSTHLPVRGPVGSRERALTVLHVRDEIFLQGISADI